MKALAVKLQLPKLYDLPFVNWKVELNYLRAPFELEMLSCYTCLIPLFLIQNLSMAQHYLESKIQTAWHSTIFTQAPKYPCFQINQSPTREDNQNENESFHLPTNKSLLLVSLIRALNPLYLEVDVTFPISSKLQHSLLSVWLWTGHCLPWV